MVVYSTARHLTGKDETMNTQKATPRPWKTRFASDLQAEMSITTEDGKTCFGLTWGHNKEANAELIVQAVNAHDALLTACKCVTNAITNEERAFALKKCFEALALAGVKTKETR